MYPLVAPAAQYIPPTSSFFYLLYEISVIQNDPAFIIRKDVLEHALGGNACQKYFGCFIILTSAQAALMDH